MTRLLQEDDYTGIRFYFGERNYVIATDDNAVLQDYRLSIENDQENSNGNNETHNQANNLIFDKVINYVQRTLGNEPRGYLVTGSSASSAGASNPATSNQETNHGKKNNGECSQTHAGKL